MRRVNVVAFPAVISEREFVFSEFDVENGVLTRGVVDGAVDFCGHVVGYSRGHAEPEDAMP